MSWLPIWKHQCVHFFLHWEMNYMHSWSPSERLLAAGKWVLRSHRLGRTADIILYIVSGCNGWGIRISWPVPQVVRPNTHFAIQICNQNYHTLQCWKIGKQRRCLLQCLICHDIGCYWALAAIYLNQAVDKFSVQFHICMTIFKEAFIRPRGSCQGKNPSDIWRIFL